MFSGASGTVRLTNAPGTTVALDHTIMPGTKLEPNIGSDRAWVFRARSEASGAGDVLALQFSDPMSAERFANTFDDLLNGRESALAATAPPAPQAAAAPAAMAAPAAAPAKKGPIRKQRRRLSVVGDTPEIDGRRSSAIGGESLLGCVLVLLFVFLLSIP